MLRNANMPDWAKVTGKGRVTIDATLAYPAMLEELWDDENWDANDTLLKELERGVMDQYWLEVAFQCMKMDIQTAMAGTSDGPIKGGALVIHIEDDSKREGGVSDFAQRVAPKGRGEKAATKGKEARIHYKRIRTTLI